MGSRVLRLRLSLVMPDDLDLREAKLPNGLELRCLEPQQAYSVKYEHEELTIDVTFRGSWIPWSPGRRAGPTTSINRVS